MGNFYVNHTVRTDDADAVVGVLRAAHRHAWVAPATDGQVVVYDEASDTQDESEYRPLGVLLSRQLGTACLAVLNHDDDVLLYELFEGGSRTETFNSNPGFFGSPKGSSTRGTRLCAAWGRPAAAFAVAGILGRKVLLAIQLHEALAKAVGLPDHSVGTGFRYVEQGEFPDPSMTAALRKVGD